MREKKMAHSFCPPSVYTWFANKHKLTIEQDVVEDIYTWTNGYAKLFRLALL